MGDPNPLGRAIVVVLKQVLGNAGALARDGGAAARFRRVPQFSLVSVSLPATPFSTDAASAISARLTNSLVLSV